MMLARVGNCGRRTALREWKKGENCTKNSVCEEKPLSHRRERQKKKAIVGLRGSTG